MSEGTGTDKLPSQAKSRSRSRSKSTEVAVSILILPYVPFRLSRLSRLMPILIIRKNRIYDKPYRPDSSIDNRTAY